MAATIVAWLIIIGARLITGAKALGQVPVLCQSGRVYIANHTSHGDFVLLWASLPSAVRKQTRPVAGADYWQKGWLRRFIIEEVFRGVLIKRGGREEGENPLLPLVEALAQQDSLILFPEGTRNLTEPSKQALNPNVVPLQPFKPGLFHLLQQHPEVQCVPVWIANVNRVMPKGRSLPLPLLCTVNFGEAFAMTADEPKQIFLQRAQQKVSELAPGEAL
ncbi:1-acyl-sn-glycerol-3-phosphate acyltransferase [Motilimonas pumila]|uniref:1-acyl-sn-glycerol-3-phosphate acyltransferase n=1 Tax=Motilimonas pumila TaxID=2303987 RepID=A0A418YF25_9GAMM|nr:1-acyl-sn-glycerol-3-phosphate acyltransferase [Motilimonas pumila]